MERQVYAHAADDLRLAQSARERKSIVARVVATLGVSEATAYRNLRLLGYDSGRKPRADKGRRALTEEQLREHSRILAKGRNKRGEPNIPLTESHRLAQEAGMPTGKVSYSTLSRQLRETGLGLRHMCAPPPAIARVSRHPNHVHFFDPSVAVPWFFKDEHGKKLDQYTDPQARFYLGKIGNIKAIRRLLYRYILVDHYSGALRVEYFYSAGERTEDVVSFLLHTWSGSEDPVIARAFPFRGLPIRLVADQGPAFKNGIVQQLLGERGLGIKVGMHTPGNPKASGTVEEAHDLWQRTFEGRLAVRMAGDLEELNRMAAAFCARLNAEREHSRHGKSRMEMWARITSEQLRECPDRKVFLRMACSTPIVRTLDNRCWIQHENQQWLVRGENIYPGQHVSMRLAPFIDVGIRVYDEFGRELAVEVIKKNEAGFPTTGRFHVWDEEEHAGAAAPLPPAQQVSQAVLKGVEQVSIPSALDEEAMREQLARTAWIVPAGQPWEPTKTAEATAAEPLIGSLEAREDIARRLGRPLGADADWWRAHIGDGVTQTQLDALWEEFSQGVVERRFA
jgi:transposase InsO family protein